MRSVADPETRSRPAGRAFQRYREMQDFQNSKDRAEIWKWRRDLLVSQTGLAGATKEEAEGRVPKVTLHVLDVSFDAISAPKERAYFMNLPTSFVLPAEDIDRLREIAGRLLNQSAEYETIVRQLGESPTNRQ